MDEVLGRTLQGQANTIEIYSEEDVWLDYESTKKYLTYTVDENYYSNYRYYNYDLTFEQAAYQQIADSERATKLLKYVGQSVANAKLPAVIGGTIGSVVPGVGTAIGAAVAAKAAFLTSLVAHTFFGAVEPGQASPVGSNIENCTDRFYAVTQLPSTRLGAAIFAHKNNQPDTRFQMVIPIYGLEDDARLTLQVHPDLDRAGFADTNLMKPGWDPIEEDHELEDIFPDCNRPSSGGTTPGPTPTPAPGPSPTPGPGPTPSPTPTPVSCENTLSGDGVVNDTWAAASSCVSQNRADDDDQDGAYAEYYTFTLTQQSEVTITLESTEDTYLYLLRGAGKDGEREAFNDDIDYDNDITNSRIVKTLAAGDYTIEATTWYANKTGDFKLTVSGIQ